MNCLKGAYNCLCGKACCCFGEGVTGQACISPNTFAFLGHAFLFSVVLGGSIGIGADKFQKIPGVSFEASCDPTYLGICEDYQLVYRVTAAVGVFFLLLAVTTSGNPQIHYDYWLVKLGGLPALVLVSMWLPNSIMTLYSYVARYLSFAFLMAQSALVLEVAVDVHDLLRLQMDRSEASGGDGGGYRWLYLVVCVGSVCGSLVGVGLMYDTATSDDALNCPLTTFLISLTLVVGVLTTLGSILRRVDQGLLTPSLVFAYSSFLCLYALSSSSCPHPTSSNILACKILALLLASMLVVFVSFNGVRMLIVMKRSSSLTSSDIDRPTITAQLIPSVERLEGGSITTRDSEVTTDSNVGSGESKYAKLPPAIFHGLLFLLALYCAMVITSWNSYDGVPIQGTHNGQVGMWLLVVAQWCTMISYITILVIAYRESAAGDYDL